MLARCGSPSLAQTEIMAINMAKHREKVRSSGIECVDAGLALPTHMQAETTGKIQNETIHILAMTRGCIEFEMVNQ
jgi:hypothetical protein